MTQYRFITTNLMTGKITGDWLPLIPQSCSRAINGTGTFTAALPLTAGTPAEQTAWLAAIEPRESVVWILLDNLPVWNGIIWDWPHESVLDGTMPIAASTMDSLFSHRLISGDLSYTADIFEIFRNLAAYALTKDQNCQVAGLNLGTSRAGLSESVTYTGTDMAPVSSAWGDLVAQYGFEYAFRPGLDTNGNLTTYLDLGYPKLGQQFPASGLVYQMPGNLTDYSWPRTGSSGANKIIATATTETEPPDGERSKDITTNWVSARPHGYDLTDLASGAPLLEQSDTLTTVTVTQQSQVDNYADGLLPAVTGAQLMPLLTLGTGQVPSVKNIQVGSWCQLALTSPLHPAGPQGQPGYQGQARITGWTLNLPTDSQAESTQIQTWIPVA